MQNLNDCEHDLLIDCQPWAHRIIKSCLDMACLYQEIKDIEPVTDDAI